MTTVEKKNPAAVNERVTLEWVNHASFVLQQGGVRLITDPWIEGKVFNQGWSLLSDSAFRYDDFRAITHIWFSHEHPDHFFPPNLKAIPLEVRRNIPILYQRTKDRKLAKFCKGLGFKEIVELAPGKWLALSPALSLMCKPVDDDSWIAFKTDKGTILNINDCVIDSAAKARAIAELVGPVRVVMTQFSYAEWVGNPEDREGRRREARQKLERIGTQSRVFDPEYVVPTASFAWFCHEENFYLNDSVIHVNDAARYIEDEIGRTAVVLYPGERWDLGSARDWRAAALHYKRDFEARMQGGPIAKPRPVTFEELEAGAHSFLKRLIRKNSRLLYCIPMLTTRVNVADLDVIIEISPRGMRRVEAGGAFDISMTADNLLYSLRFDWGSSTVHGNGRFRSAAGDSYQKFFRFFRVADDNNHGRHMNAAWLASKIVKRGARVLSQRLGRPR